MLATRFRGDLKCSKRDRLSATIHLPPFWGLEEGVGAALSRHLFDWLNREQFHLARFDAEFVAQLFV